MQRQALGVFLRSRRERTSPEQVGLPASDRRTPGVRRSEVAELAHISEIHYANIEQGRGARPSPEVLGAITHALRLDVGETQHVFELADARPPRAPGPAIDLSDRTRRLLRSLDGVPALVCSARFDVIGQSLAAVSLLGDLLALPSPDRNLARRHFLPDHQDHVWGAPNHAAFSRFAAAQLRGTLARYPEDRPTQDLISDLGAGSAEFAALWHELPVGFLAGDALEETRVFIGSTVVRCDVSILPDRDQYLIFLTPDLLEENQPVI